MVSHRAKPKLNTVINILEELVIENHTKTVALTNDLAILTLRNTKPQYRPARTLGNHKCHTQNKDSHQIWIEATSKILISLGINEINLEK